MATVLAGSNLSLGSVSGNNIVYLQSNRMVTAIISGTTIKLQKTFNKGASWSTLTDINATNSLLDVALVGISKDYVGVLASTQADSLFFYKVNINDGTYTTSTIDSGRLSITNVAITIDPITSHLHAIWMSRHSTSSSVFNIRYASSNNLGQTWNTPIFITQHFANTGQILNNSIAAFNNTVSIACSFQNGLGGYDILAYTKPSSLTVFNTPITVASDTRQLYNINVDIDHNGIFHFAWSLFQGGTSGNRVFYAKSVDGGISAIHRKDVALGSSPTLQLTKDNKIFIVYISNSYKISIATYTNDGIFVIDEKNLTSIPMQAQSFQGDYLTDVYENPLLYVTNNGVEFVGDFKNDNNNEPIINITSPTANQTLYENDTVSIIGTASDANAGNSVTVRYQINANTVRAIKAFVSDGTTLEAFSKQLRFSGGSLYDGDTLIASSLTDGVAYKLKVWATDDQNGTSPIVERDFFVVPNRAPSLTVNPPVSTGIIDSDEIEITGSYNDMDRNTSIVSYRINGGASVQVATGTSGDFDFKIKIGQLKVGLNNIIVEVIDSYGAKTSRTVKLQKNEVKTEQLKSTARYKILPPLNTATGVVIWVRRDPNLLLDAKMSMHQTGEAENFVAMTKAVTAPVPNVADMLEDQYQYEVATAVDNIILQIDMERTSTAVNDKIYLIVGVID